MAGVQPLVSTSWLSERLADPALRVIDVRWYLADHAQGHREYLNAHVPGAQYLDVETDLSATTGRGRHPLPSPEVFAATLARRGIGNHHTVVAYDSAGGAVAARLWWRLRHLGHDDVAVLDGGWQAWTEEGLETTSEVSPLPPEEFVARVRPGGVIEREELLDRMGEWRLIDARALERYEGIFEPVDPAAGHIPSAINMDFAGNLGADGRFLDPETLRRRYAVEGKTSAGDTVVYCGSGVTACHTLLAHVVAGLPEPKLYAGSWSDWAGAGLPVAVGAEPGTL